jgi:hypothetical protein
VLLSPCHFKDVYFGILVDFRGDCPSLREWLKISVLNHVLVYAKCHLGLEPDHRRLGREILPTHVGLRDSISVLLPAWEICLFYLPSPNRANGHLHMQVSALGVRSTVASL